MSFCPLGFNAFWWNGVGPRKAAGVHPSPECKPPCFEWASGPHHARDTPQHTVSTPGMLGLTPRMLGIRPKVVGVTPRMVGRDRVLHRPRGACIRDRGVGTCVGSTLAHGACHGPAGLLLTFCSEKGLPSSLGALSARPGAALLVLPSSGGGACPQAWG